MFFSIPWFEIDLFAEQSFNVRLEIILDFQMSRQVYEVSCFRILSLNL